MVRESILDETWKAMRVGMLALIRPVMTSTTGPLRRQDQVDARGTRLLRQACDQFLDLLAHHHHQVGQLVDHHHHVGHVLQRLRGFSGVSEKGLVSGSPAFSRH
jgi:hypothetical protein